MACRASREFEKRGGGLTATRMVNIPEEARLFVEVPVAERQVVQVGKLIDLLVDRHGRSTGLGNGIRPAVASSSRTTFLRDRKFGALRTHRAGTSLAPVFRASIDGRRRCRRSRGAQYHDKAGQAPGIFPMM